MKPLLAILAAALALPTLVVLGIALGPAILVILSIAGSAVLVTGAMWMAGRAAPH